MSLKKKGMFLAFVVTGLVASGGALLFQPNEGILMSPEDPFCPNCAIQPGQGEGACRCSRKQLKAANFFRPEARNQQSEFGT